MKRTIGALVPLTLFVGMTMQVIGTTSANAVGLTSCTPTGSLGANDDGSTGALSLPFPIDFFGTTWTSLYANNNGNVTFSSPTGAFTPQTIGTGLGFPIIAPFWADVDTRGTTPPSAILTYGTGTFSGHQAFCVTWDGVGYFGGHTDKLNKFQLLLVRRSDVGSGDFDIVFNYNQIQWETGDASGGSGGVGGQSARAGYSDGVENSSELTGSGVNGAFLDGGLDALASGTNGSTPGRFIFAVRNGQPVQGAPNITTESSTTFTEGSEGSFTVATTGDPTPTISEDGTLPSGVTFTDNGDGTATLGGTPDIGAGTPGDYPLTITATNGTQPDAVQSFDLTVDPGPYASISGTVWNDLNGNGVADTPAESGKSGVTVCLDQNDSGACDGEDTNTTTDANGNYSFPDLTPGFYQVTFTEPDGWHNTGNPSEYNITLGADENSTNDFFIQTNGVAPSLSLTKSGSPDPVQEQNPITYTLQTTNGGTPDATGVALTDTIPGGTTFNQVSTDTGSCSFSSGTVTCNIGTLAGGATATVTIIVQAPNVTADTVITNNASATSNNAGNANASADTTVQVNQGGSTEGQVPPDTTAPLTFTTGTQSSNGQTNVTAGDKTAVSIVVPPGGPGGSVQLDELQCQVAPCTGPLAAAKEGSARSAQPAATTGKLVLGGVVYNVIPPDGYPNSKPFKVIMLWDKTLGAKKSPVYYFKPGVTPTEITLAHCGTTPPNGGKPCVLTNAQITTGPPAIRGDWKVTVRINSDPRMRK